MLQVGMRVTPKPEAVAAYGRRFIKPGLVKAIAGAFVDVLMDGETEAQRFSQALWNEERGR